MDGVDNNHNPQPILDAVISPSKISLATLAVLEKARSPVLMRDIVELVENIKAVYLVNLPYSEAAREIASNDYEAHAVEWADKIGWDEYQKKFAELITGLFAFWKMLPPEEKKKTEQLTSESETDGSES